MISISPVRGQPTEGKFLPSIQKADQAPLPTGGFIRASTFPYLKENLLSVLILAEVMVPLRLPHAGGLAHMRALIADYRQQQIHYSVMLVYNCHSSLPQP